MSRPLPFPHLFMAISAAVLSALAVFVLIVPSIADGVESACTGGVTTEGPPLVWCGDGTVVVEPDLADIR
jgi:hypothetical protein